MPELRARILGAIFGHLVGDALGVPYEFLSPERIGASVDWRGGGTHGQPIGTWSDDGALMLCQVTSLVDCGGFQPKDTAERFVRWRREGYQAAGNRVFDIGITTAAAIDRLENGIPPLDAGETSERSNGNGSLMRILPIGLWFHDRDLTSLVQASHDASRITHGHARSQVCCALHNLVLRELLAAVEPAAALERAASQLRRAYQETAKGENLFLVELDAILGYSERSGSGYVVDCWWSAWTALTTTVSYVDCIRRAVRFGHDTDTTACVAGGLAGAWYGIESVPVEWRQDLRLSDDQKRMIDRFADLASGRRTSGEP